MEGLATTRMSSKGQVVIPEEVRNRLGLKAGMQFVVVGNRLAGLGVRSCIHTFHKTRACGIRKQVGRALRPSAKGISH